MAGLMLCSCYRAPATATVHGTFQATLAVFFPILLLESNFTPVIELHYYQISVITLQYVYTIATFQ